jgi:hypothetical protein
MLRLTRQLALVAAILWLGVPARGSLDLQTPAGLNPGDQFRFVFVTSGSTQPFSGDINVYNNFINSQAGGATYNGSVVHWSVIGSTSSVNAIDNVGQTATPVYLADGTLVTTSTTSSGLWSGSILHPINEDLSGALHPGFGIYTGTLANGQRSNNPLNSFSITLGNSSSTNALWVQGVAFPDIIPLRMYGISQVETVTPEPSSFVTIGTALIGVGAFGWSRRRTKTSRASRADDEA